MKSKLNNADDGNNRSSNNNNEKWDECDSNAGFLPNGDAPSFGPCETDFFLICSSFHEPKKNNNNNNNNNKPVSTCSYGSPDTNTINSAIATATNNRTTTTVPIHTPAFVVIGVQKSGSTAMLTHFRDHPQVLQTVHKLRREGHFFDTSWQSMVVKKAEVLGLKSADEKNCLALEQYMQLFETEAMLKNNNNGSTGTSSSTSTSSVVGNNHFNQQQQQQQQQQQHYHVGYYKDKSEPSLAASRAETTRGGGSKSCSYRPAAAATRGRCGCGYPPLRSPQQQQQQQQCQLQARAPRILQQ